MERGFFRFRRQYGSNSGMPGMGERWRVGKQAKTLCRRLPHYQMDDAPSPPVQMAFRSSNFGFRNIAMPRNVCGPQAAVTSVALTGDGDRACQVLRQHASRLEPRDRQISQRWRDTPNIYVPSRLSPAASLRFPAQVTIPSKSGTWTHYVASGNVGEPKATCIRSPSHPTVPDRLYRVQDLRFDLGFQIGCVPASFKSRDHGRGLPFR